MVFAVGFALGTFRVLVEEPRLGATLSVALELPVMLLASWLVARRIVAGFGLDLGRGSRIVMGATGLVLLLVAETVLGVALGQTVSDQLAAYATVRGLLNLIGQIGFALMPLVV